MTTTAINKIFLNSADSSQLILEFSSSLNALSYSGTIDPLDFKVKSASDSAGLGAANFNDVTAATFLNSYNGASNQILLSLTSSINQGHTVNVQYDNDFHDSGPGLMTAYLSGGEAIHSGGHSGQFYNSTGFSIEDVGSNAGKIKLDVPNLDTDLDTSGSGVHLTYVNDFGVVHFGSATAVQAIADGEDSIFITPVTPPTGFDNDDLIEVIYQTATGLSVGGTTENSFAAHKYTPGGLGDIKSVSNFISSTTGNASTTGNVEITFHQPIVQTATNMSDLVSTDLEIFSYASGDANITANPTFTSSDVMNVPVSFSTATADASPIAVDYDNSNGSIILEEVTSAPVSSILKQVDSIQTTALSGQNAGSPHYDIEHYFSTAGSVVNGKAEISGVNILVEKNGSFVNRENLGNVSDGVLKAYINDVEISNNPLADGVLSVGAAGDIKNNNGSVDVTVKLIDSQDSTNILAEDTIYISSDSDQQSVIKLNAQGKDLNDTDGSSDNTGIEVTPIDLLTAPTSNSGLEAYSLSAGETIKAYVADNSSDIEDTSSLGSTGQLVTDAGNDNKYDFATELANKSHVKFELEDANGNVISGNGPLPVSNFKSHNHLGTQTTDIESVKKVDSDELEVQFKNPLIQDNQALESEDFIIDNGVVVSNAAFKYGVPDTVVLTAASELPHADLEVTYDPDNSAGSHQGGLKQVTGVNSQAAQDSVAVADVRDGYTTNVVKGSGSDDGKILMQFSNGITASGTLEKEDVSLLVKQPGADENLDTEDDTVAWVTAKEAPTVDGGNLVITPADSIQNLDTVIGAAFDGTEGAVTDTTLTVALEGGDATIGNAEVVLGSRSGNILEVSEVKEVSGQLTVDVKFDHKITDGTDVTASASEFKIYTVNDIQNLPTDNGATAETVTAKIGTTDTVSLTIASSDTDASENSYVSVEYSGASVKLDVPMTTMVNESSKTLVAPETVQKFSEGSLSGFGSDDDNTFNLATGGFDFDSADSAGDYKAFGGDGNDVATNIDAGDTFIGGDGYDVATVEGKFQDYVFSEVDTSLDANGNPNDAVFGSEILDTIDVADSVGEIEPSNLGAFKTEYINDGSDNVEPSSKDGGDPYASTVAEHTIWSLKANNAGSSDGMSVVQAEKIMFEDDPNITIDTDLATTKIEEKENLASDFRTQTIEFELDSTYDSTQQLFWQIQENKADSATAEEAKNHAILDDFAYTTGYVTVADDENTGSFDILVRNDGDKDEREESFDIKIGYIVGPNVAETVTIGTPSTAANATNVDFEETDNVITLDSGHADYSDNPTTLAVDLGGETATSLAITAAPANADISAITIGGAGKNDFKDFNTSLKVLVEDTAGNEVDIGHMILHTDTVGATTGLATITSYDLAYAASSDNIFLEQASITTQIKADPTEWYVFSGWDTNVADDKIFSGKDFLGQTTTKTINGNDNKSFVSIQDAIDAYSHTDYDDMTQLELRVAEDHEESGTIDVTKNGLFIDFWDVGGTDKDDQMLTFKLGSSVVDLELGGTRNAKVIGNSEANRIIGNDGDNIIYGKDGNDDILGKGGDDIIFAGKGDDFADGGAGSDKVYGNQGADILQATDDAHSTPAVDSTAELSSKDLLSGGSGDDVLIDMANKSAAGKVVMLGGSGKDKISVDSDRSNLDYSGTHRAVLPFDQEDSVVRKIQTKIVDLSQSDKLDTSAINKETAEIADVEGTGDPAPVLRDGDSKDKLFLLSDLSGAEDEFKIDVDMGLTTGTRSSASNNGNDTIVDLTSTYGTEAAADGYLYIKGMEVPTEKGSGQAATDTLPARPPSYFDSNAVSVDAPLQKVEGKIEISHAGLDIIEAAADAVVPKTDSAQEVFNDITFDLKEIDDQVIFLPTS